MTKLLNFTVGNFRSFGENRTFTFLTDKRAGRAGKGTFKAGPYRLSVISACYGANSGGKSNLVDAMALMRMIIRESVRINEDEPLPYDPFVLTAEQKNGPQTFDLSFIDDEETVYRYGFKNTADGISREWLFTEKKGARKEFPLFVRKDEKILVDDEAFPEGVPFVDNCNRNRLFLSLVGQLGGKIAKKVLSFFIADFNILSGLESRGYGAFTQEQFDKKNEVASKALNFFKRIDLGFDDIEIHREPISPDFLNRFPEEIRQRAPKEQLKTYSVHKIPGTSDMTLEAPFEDFESSGTQKVFDLSGPVFDTLNRGAVLVIDELDAKLHPLLTREIIRLFASEESNPGNAQLFFSTHDSNLLSSKLLRADQIWFVEKDRLMRSDLYRATDMVLPDGTPMPVLSDHTDFYLSGRYGATPFIK